MSGANFLNGDGLMIALHSDLSMMRFYESVKNLVNEISNAVSGQLLVLSCLYFALCPLLLALCRLLRPADLTIGGAPSTQFKRCVRHRARTGELLQARSVGHSTLRDTLINLKFKRPSLSEKLF